MKWEELETRKVQGLHFNWFTGKATRKSVWLGAAFVCVEKVWCGSGWPQLLLRITWTSGPHPSCFYLSCWDDSMVVLAPLPMLRWKVTLVQFQSWRADYHERLVSVWEKWVFTWLTLSLSPWGCCSSGIVFLLLICGFAFWGFRYQQSISFSLKIFDGEFHVWETDVCSLIL